MMLLDLSDQKMKVTQADSLASTELDGGIIKNGRLQKPAEFKAALHALLSSPARGAFRGKQITLLMPEQQCYHYVFPLNKTVEESLAAVLPFELDQMRWESEITRQDDHETMVYAVAIPNAVVETYEDVLTSLGLSLVRVQPHTYTKDRSAALVIQLGEHETVLATMDELGIHQSSVLDAGTSNIKRAMMRGLRTDDATVQQALENIGLRQLNHPTLPAMHEAISTTVNQVIREAKQHLAFYRAQGHRNPEPLRHIILKGHGASIPGLSEALSRVLQTID